MPNIEFISTSVSSLSYITKFVLMLHLFLCLHLVTWVTENNWTKIEPFDFYFICICLHMYNNLSLDHVLLFAIDCDRVSIQKQNLLDK